MLVRCDNCGKIFNKPPSRIREHNFCCNECRYKFSNKKVIFTCTICGKEILRYKSKIRKNHFCSPECYYKFLENNGTRKGCKISEETRRKMSEAAKGEKNHFWGKHLTEEHKKKIGDSQKGKEGYWKGKQRPKTAIKKASEKMKGHKCSNETREKISNSNSGKKRTLKQREAMSLRISKLYQEKKNAFVRGSKQGYFESVKNKNRLFYRSSYELKAYQLLEKNKKVIKFEREKFRIPYFDEINRIYIPDIFVEYENGDKTIIEIKASWALSNKRNKIKFKAAEDFAAKKSYNFKIWTEKELKIAI